MIDDNSRLRHPRKGGTTESGICFIQTDSALSELTLLNSTKSA
ncbi:MAG: hypothetical protein ABJG42_17675 [Vibrio splendidus]